MVYKNTPIVTKCQTERHIDTPYVWPKICSKSKQCSEKMANLVPLQCTNKNCSGWLAARR